MSITEDPTTMSGMCHARSDAGAVIRDTLARVGDKWSLLILGMLEGQPLRFTVLRDAVPGISHRMLTLTLRNLERDGLVSRHVFAEVPPRVEYAVTDLGATILPAVKALGLWALENGAEVQRNRDEFDDAH
jgi:DNA-binding HxlR family transcriptional regulator